MSEAHTTTGGVPVIESQRLIMRGHRRDDFADCVMMWADPRVTRYIGGKPFAAEEVWVKATKPEPPIPFALEEVAVEVWRQSGA